MIKILNRANTFSLCKTPLDKSNLNQMTFSDPISQQNYFLSTVVRTVLDVSYIREPVQGETKSYISIDVPIEKLDNCNYVMYKNTGSNRFYYAFIDRLEYRSPTVTFIHLISDSFQNNQFEIEYKKSFIERQTPLSDNYNTLADGVAHGQLVEKTERTHNFGGMYLAFCSSDPTQDVTTDSTPRSLKIGKYTIPCWALYWRDDEGEDMGKTLNRITDNGWGDRIVAVNYIPLVDRNVKVRYTDYESERIGSIKIAVEIPTEGLKITTLPIDVPSATYRKALTYPYTKVVVQDKTTGQSQEFSLEKFKGNNPRFEIRGTVSETPYYRVIPMNYEGQDLAMNHSMVINCNTSLPIVNNLYAKYMMTNKEGNEIAKFGAMSGLVGGIASGNPIGATLGVMSTYTAVAGITNQETQAAKLGNSVTSITDGAQERANNNEGIKISIWTMDDDHLSMANNYWKMLGYPVNSLGTPNIKGNRYNYVKLGVPNIIGKTVPQDEIEEIREMFYKGITLWHSPSDYLNY